METVTLNLKLSEDLAAEFQKLNLVEGLRREGLDVSKGRPADLPAELQGSPSGEKSVELIIVASGVSLGGVIVAVKALMDSWNRRPVTVKTRTVAPVVGKDGRPTVDAYGKAIVRIEEKEEVIQPTDHSLVKYEIDAGVIGMSLEMGNSDSADPH